MRWGVLAAAAVLVGLALAALSASAPDSSGAGLASNPAGKPYIRVWLEAKAGNRTVAADPVNPDLVRAIYNYLGLAPDAWSSQPPGYEITVEVDGSPITGNLFPDWTYSFKPLVIAEGQTTDTLTDFTVTAEPETCTFTMNDTQAQAVLQCTYYLTVNSTQTNNENFVLYNIRFVARGVFRDASGTTYGSAADPALLDVASIDGSSLGTLTPGATVEVTVTVTMDYGYPLHKNAYRLIACQLLGALQVDPTLTDCQLTALDGSTVFLLSTPDKISVYIADVDYYPNTTVFDPATLWWTNESIPVAPSAGTEWEKPFSADTLATNEGVKIDITQVPTIGGAAESIVICISEGTGAQNNIPLYVFDLPGSSIGAGTKIRFEGVYALSAS